MLPAPYDLVILFTVFLLSSYVPYLGLSVPSLISLSLSLFLLSLPLLTLLPLLGCRVKMLVSGLWLCWMSKEVSSDCFSKDVNHSQSTVLTVCNSENQGHKTRVVMYENLRNFLSLASLSGKGMYNNCVRVCISFQLFPINIKESCRLNSSKSSFLQQALG